MRIPIETEVEECSMKHLSSCWFQTPLKNMLIKMGSSSQIGVKIKNIWKNHPSYDMNHEILIFVCRDPYIGSLLSQYNWVACDPL